MSIEGQLSLLDLPPFSPIPAGRYHYVPALLNWSGEREALRLASDSTWQRMTPLVQVAPWGIANKQEVSTASVADWAKQIRRAVGPHPIYLDTLGIDAKKSAKPSGGQSILSLLYEAARHRGLVFVPVYKVGDAAHAPIVASAAAQDGRGVAIRYQASNTLHIGRATIAEALKTEAERLEVKLADADVIVDFGFLGPDDELTAKDVLIVLEDAISAGPWRNIILLATSIPSSFAHIAEGTIGAVKRREWSLWNEVRDQGGARVVFGDYGIQHPRAPDRKGGGRMRANIRYTTSEGVLVARGEGPILELEPALRSQQYRKLCHDLVMNRLFIGRDCCMGDRIIQDCADGRLAPAGQPMWRGAGTAHNPKAVTSSLEALESAAVSTRDAAPSSRRARPAAPVQAQPR